MSRGYVDFWISLVEDVDLSEMLIRVKKLGFSSIVVSSIDEDKFEDVKRIGKDIGVEVYRKIVLEADDRSDLLKALRRYRGTYEVITVICNNLEVALTAARDSRVDTLIFPPSKRFRIDRGVAAIIRNCIEIPFKWFLNRSIRRDFLRVVDEIIDYLANRVDMIVSSSASKPSELRSPYEMASLLQVFGSEKENALDSLSTIPNKIIRTNLIKLSSSYIGRGVMKIG